MRLTPATAAAFRALRYGPITVKSFLSSFSQTQRTAAATFGRIYEVGGMRDGDPRNFESLANFQWVTP